MHGMPVSPERGNASLNPLCGRHALHGMPVSPERGSASLNPLCGRHALHGMPVSPERGNASLNPGDTPLRAFAFYGFPRDAELAGGFGLVAVAGSQYAENVLALDFVQCGALA